MTKHHRTFKWIPPALSSTSCNCINKTPIAWSELCRFTLLEKTSEKTVLESQWRAPCQRLFTDTTIRSQGVDPWSPASWKVTSVSYDPGNSFCWKTSNWGVLSIFPETDCRIEWLLPKTREQVLIADVKNLLPKKTQLCQFFATPWTVACQAFLSMGFSRQEYPSGFPCPPPGNLPNQGLNPGFPLCRWILLWWIQPPEKTPKKTITLIFLFFTLFLFLCSITNLVYYCILIPSMSWLKGLSMWSLLSS